MTHRLLIITGNVNAAMAALLSNGVMQFLLMILHLVVVFVDFGIIGWLMHGFNVPIMVCAATFLVCCYLVWVGSGGIALASVWVVGLMSMAVINQQWLHGLPRPKFYYIPLLLLANWLFALCVVWQVGKISDAFQQKAFSREFGFAALVGFVAVGSIVGWQSYTKTILFFTSMLL